MGCPWSFPASVLRQTLVHHSATTLLQCTEIGSVLHVKSSKGIVVTRSSLSFHPRLCTGPSIGLPGSSCLEVQTFFFAYIPKMLNTGGRLVQCCHIYSLIFPKRLCSFKVVSTDHRRAMSEHDGNSRSRDVEGVGTRLRALTYH